MVTQTIEFQSIQSTSQIVRLFSTTPGDEAVVQTASSVSISTSRKMVQAVFEDVPAGQYRVLAFYNGIRVASWYTTLTLSTGTFECYDETVRSVKDKSNYNLTQQFPENFGLLQINSSGHVSRVTLVDTTTANSDMRGTDNALPAASYTAPDNAGIGTLLTRMTASRSLYLDNLNVGGPVASQADINAINQSASRRLILTNLQQLERPESGSILYQIEARTFDGDGANVNADSTPVLTPVGTVSGILSGNLSAATNPATGVYRWNYSVSSSSVLEQIRFDLSAVISSTTFTIASYSAVVDLVSTTWNSTDAARLTAIFDKLPTRGYLVGSTFSAGTLVPGDILNELPSAGWASGSFGDRLLVAATTNRTAFLTGSNHIAADVHAFQADVLNATATDPSFVSEIQAGLATLAGQVTAQNSLTNIQSRIPTALVNGRMDASVGAIDQSIVTTIQTGLATESTLLSVDTKATSIKSVTDKLNTGLIQDGSVWQWTINALELAPSGGGGGGQAGPGSDQVTVTISDNGTPIDDCSVWISLDSAGLNVIAGTLVTNVLGQVVFLLNQGVVYYLWAEKSGMTPITGRAFTAVADE